MYTFPLLAAFTICVSFAVLHASFDDLREAPLTLDRNAVPVRQIFARHPLPSSALPVPSTIYEANEGLLDREIASGDPLQAWLDRYLTPPAK